MTSANRSSPTSPRRCRACGRSPPDCGGRRRHRRGPGRSRALPPSRPPGEVELHASWSAGTVVVWAAGRGRPAESHDEVSARLEAIGAAPVGWQPHPGVRLPGAAKADAHAIALEDALGWLVSIGVGHRADEVGASLRWLGRVAYEGVRLAATGSIVPTLRVRSGGRGQRVTAEVRWRPALVDSPALTALAAAMPGTVALIDRDERRGRRRRPSSPRWSRRSSARASSGWSCRRPRRR